MNKEINKTLIGAFILGAVILAAAAIIVLGGGRLVGESERFVLYFSGSVNGLGLGAPVKFKGVPLGKVSAINLVYAPASKTFLTQVIVDVTKGSVIIVGELEGEGPANRVATSEASIEEMIEAGLRAKLRIQSFVSGQLLVAFDFFPDTPVNLMGFGDELAELPTLPSDLETLAKTLDTVDIQGIAESIVNVSTGIDQLVNSSDLKKAILAINDTLQSYRQLAIHLDQDATHLTEELSATLADIRQVVHSADDKVAPMATEFTETAVHFRRTLADLDGRLNPILENLNETATSARAAFQQGESALANLAYLSKDDSTLIYRIEETLAELKKAAGAIAVLADYLGRHPEALLRGRIAAQEGK